MLTELFKRFKVIFVVGGPAIRGAITKIDLIDYIASMATGEPK